MANFFKDNSDLVFTLNNLDLAEVAALREDNYKLAQQFDNAPTSFEDALDNYNRVLEIVGEICGDRIGPLVRELLVAGVAEQVDAEVDPFPLQAVQHILKVVEVRRAEPRPAGRVLSGHQQQIHALKADHVVPLAPHLRGELADILPGLLRSRGLKHRLLPGHQVVCKRVEREEADRPVRAFLETEAAVRTDHRPAVFPGRARLVDAAQVECAAGPDRQSGHIDRFPGLIGPDDPFSVFRLRPGECRGADSGQKQKFLGVPKTIDNDIYGTDMTFGFQSAVDIATDAIDCIHTTAASHGRVFIVEVMGHKVGWLTLNAGMAGGADIILIPEIPYDIDKVIEKIEDRDKKGCRFTIIAVAEGAISKEDAALPKKDYKKKMEKYPFPSVSYEVAAQIQEKTGREVRVTVPGHMQRGGSPCPYDRVFASRLGSEAGKLILDNQYGFMVGYKNREIVRVPLEDVAGKLKTVDPDATIVQEAKMLGICFGD